jgi:hypothetical protein
LYFYWNSKIPKIYRNGQKNDEINTHTTNRFKQRNYLATFDSWFFKGNKIYREIERERGEKK